MKPPASLRQAWREHISIEDYESHMAAVGQAQANASLLEELFCDYAPRLGARILFAGAGTGQYFDYLPTNLLGRYRTTFADINPVYLTRLSERITGAEIATVVDDIEDSRLPGPYDLAVVILVLEHTDWRRAVECLTGQAARVFVVIQQDPVGPAPIRLRGTLSVLCDIAPTLVSRSNLTQAFEAKGFHCRRSSAREVDDGKSMLALDFMRAA